MPLAYHYPKLFVFCPSLVIFHQNVYQSTNTKMNSWSHILTSVNLKLLHMHTGLYSGFPHFTPTKFPDFSSICHFSLTFILFFPDTHLNCFFFKYGLHLLLGNCIINTTMYTKLCLLQYLAVKPPLIAIQRPLYCL